MDMYINKDTIKQLRQEKSWSQEKLAEAAHMNLRTIQRIEKDGIASLRSCAALATALGVEPRELQSGVETEIPGVPRQSAYRQLVSALSILAVVLMLWGVAQLAVSHYELSAYQGAVVSFMFMFLAAFVLLAFLTPIAMKRFYIYFACAVLAMVISPPELLAQLKMTLPLVLLFEVSLFLAKRFRVADDSFPDAI